MNDADGLEMQMVDSWRQRCACYVRAKISASGPRRREALKKRRKSALDGCDDEQGGVLEGKGAERLAELVGLPSRQVEKETGERRVEWSTRRGWLWSQGWKGAVEAVPRL
jgi:hypothetical protein